MGRIAGDLAEAASLLSDFQADATAQGAVDQFISRLVECFQSGGKVLVGGNGGSLADAMHFAEEFTGRFRRDRKPLPVLAMADPTHLTCVSNDYGFEQVFSRYVEAFASKGDMVVLLSTSGNSANLLAAARSGREKGATVVGLLGRGGGALAPLCDLEILTPGDTSDRIQEIQMLSLHAVIRAVEADLGLG
jgi:D-sedoheptulose 7-phosphate isomerase